MGLLNELGLNPADMPTAEDFEKKLQAGDLPPEGIHHAVLVSVGAVPNSPGRGWMFTFEILAGPGKGAQIEEVLWKPKGEDEKKDATMRNRGLLFGVRLGLLKKVMGEGGKEKLVEVEGKYDFADCIGATTFLELVHEDEKFTGKNGQQRTIKKAKVTFNGLLDASDKKVKDGKVPTASVGAVAAAVQNTPAAGQGRAKAKDDFGDL